jgi:hypothetical protein
MSEEKKLLLISCSSKKSRKAKRDGGLMEASSLYRGSVFRYSLLYAARNDLIPLILSAKYGIIQPTTKIAWYDQKMVESYDGPWPKGEGWWVGSFFYFEKVPTRFAPLIPDRLGIGDYLSALLLKMAGTTLEPLYEHLPFGHGVIGSIQKILLEEKLSKEELYQRLSLRFGPNEGMRGTISCQLSQKRCGPYGLILRSKKRMGGKVEFWYERENE